MKRFCVAILCFPGPQLEEFSASNLSSKIIAVLNMVPVSNAYRDIQNQGIFAHFLFLGRVDEVKGIFDLIKAYQRLKQEFTHIRLTVVGDGPALEKCKHLADKYEIKDIVFTGNLIGEEKKNVIQTANVFVLPSFAEGLPLSALECVHYGLALIATSNSALPAIMSPGQEMLAVKPGDTMSLYGAMKYCVENPENCKAMSIRAKNVAKSKCSLEAGAQQFDTIYKQALNR